jgi:hypothetical protein
VTISQTNIEWPVTMAWTTGAELFRQIRGLADTLAATPSGSDPGQLAVPLIRGAPFGQVQRPVDQRMPAARGIGHGDRDLAQRDTAHSTAVLPRRAHRIGRGSRTCAVTHLTCANTPTVTNYCCRT